MSSILEQIVADKRPEVEELKKGRDFERYMEEASRAESPRDFRKALVRKEKITLIAEMKKASPSKGVFREEFEPREIALAYAKGGAAALSVLTEEKYFQGHPGYLKVVHETVKIPALRKDFIIDAFQVPESRLLGADAILLIASILTNSEMKRFIDLARSLNLAVLCEVHDETEMRRVIDCGADLIGINNRDLKTFEVTLQTTFDLVGLAPKKSVVVSESGIRCYADLEILRDVGVSAVLVGETLIRQSDLSQAIRNLYNPSAPSPFRE
ncbi:MAG: indole-3-glycerol phosphate synthase 2 [Candidatus Hinthialibacteria bacterium]|jgi:indole-3-glycerol phosphate synthase